MDATSDAATCHIELTIPRLSENPVITGGPCCAIRADEVVVIRLGRLAAVRSVQVDSEQRRVDVELEIGNTTPEDLIAVLRGLKLAPSLVIVREGVSSARGLTQTRDEPCGAQDRLLGRP